MHTDATRRARRAVRAIHAMSRGSRIAERVPRPPATMSVSTGPVACAIPRCATSATPLDVAIGPEVGAINDTS